jgi:hypothetical protein
MITYYHFEIHFLAKPGVIVLKSVSEPERAWYPDEHRDERGREPSSDFLAGKINCLFSKQLPLVFKHKHHKNNTKFELEIRRHFP